MDDQEIISIEKSLWSKGYRFVAGVDEAGRGPLAGPVVAAAVVFSPHVKPFLFRDSKKLTKRERERLFREILKSAYAVGVGFADSTEIDELNIYRATLLAAERAIEELPLKPDYLITDYLKIPKFAGRLIAIPKGDERSFSCACASVVAKVVRDFIMEELHTLFPNYGFNKHKGYPTKTHYGAVRSFGLSPVHRRSFGKLSQERENGGNSGFPASTEERLLYYREKLQVLLRRAGLSGLPQGE
ncbi:ribonuclease HII [Thermovibrio ammonificans]|uniref:Ribonuclease HII n=1 Tax=Thermovibrio ammonificans (strain DSM 15698 / JCM 12110 / HB-1) TaxID=648996 RepID=E8T4P8_THEA1|nr:ribonuclease HII [Thermovibrio ammonificans]ADU97506.1 Ribonuclease H [Thermovibrio ammonificans HB-1]